MRTKVSTCLLMISYYQVTLYFQQPDRTYRTQSGLLDWTATLNPFLKLCVHLLQERGGVQTLINKRLQNYTIMIMMATAL